MGLPERQHVLGAFQRAAAGLGTRESDDRVVAEHGSALHHDHARVIEHHEAVLRVSRVHHDRRSGFERLERHSFDGDRSEGNNILDGGTFIG